MSLRLTPKLKTLILMGTGRTGSLDPDDVFPMIEEQLTAKEVATTERFLNWLIANQFTIGHGNIVDRWAEHEATLKPGK